MRYTRHELKQDKFAETASAAVSEVVEHRSGIIRLVVAIAVVAVLAGGAYWYISSTMQKSDDALGRALVTYNAPILPPGTPSQGSMITFNSDQERLSASKKAFYEVSDKYGWTKSGQYARYLAGLTEMELGNYKVAEDQLRALGNTRRRDLASLAKFALASVYREENRDQDAINMLQSLIEKPTVAVPKVNSQLALADIYVAEHQNDKAKIVYEQIAKDNPKNDALVQLAKGHEQDLK